MLSSLDRLDFLSETGKVGYTYCQRNKAEMTLEVHHISLSISGPCLPSEILPLSTVFFQPVELVTTCTLTMLGALEVVRAAYCAL